VLSQAASCDLSRVLPADAEGGHMTMLTNPHLVNPLMTTFLHDEQISANSLVYRPVWGTATA
jgi:hypothetical protein